MRELYIEVGSKCYLNCRHCSSEACAISEETISTHKLCSLLKQGKRLGANSLTISGGEPLLHEGLSQFARFATKIGYSIKMYSCGVLKEDEKFVSICDEIFDSLKKTGITTLIFSLHGKPETHDYITSLKGSYLITLESIKRAIIKGFKVEIHIVPMKVNFTEIPYVFNIAKELGINQVSLLRLVPQGRLRKNLHLVMDKQDYLSFKEIINSLKDDELNLRLGSPFSCLFTDRVNSCSAGKNKLLIGPNGDVYPCEAFKTILKGRSSNIYETNLEDIWLNDSALKMIRKLSIDQVSHCKTCEASNNCNGGCIGERIIKYGSPEEGPDPICIRYNEK